MSKRQAAALAVFLLIACLSFGQQANNLSFVDRSTSIQTAINNACDGTKPGRVLLPFGTSHISNSLIIPSNCIIEGRGAGKSTIQLAGDTRLSKDGLLVNSNPSAGNAGISLRAFTVDANHRDVPAIYFSRVSNSSVTHMELKNAGAKPMIGGDSCLVWASGQVSATANQANAENLVESNYIHDCGGDAIGIGGVKVRIGLNLLTNNGDTAVGLQGFGTKEVVVADNTMHNNACGVCAGPEPGAPLGAGANDEVTVARNVITNDTAAGYGIYLVQTTGGLVSANKINIPPSGRNNSPGVFLEGSSSVVVAGNTITRSAGEGIFVECGHSSASSRDISISGNRVTKSGLSGIHVEALVSGCTLENVRISGNVIDASGQRDATLSSNMEIRQAAGATLTGVSILGNVAIDTQPVKTARYGLFVAGKPSNVTLNDNSFGGASGPAQNLGSLLSPVYGTNKWVGAVWPSNGNAKSLPARP